ncbi:MAG: YtxH domain-containing protein [Lactobacillales bacterium]|jgi:gas vesicle protein|nr:YtxH domain-containing protein [Lactobacillales bacterium]
MSKKGGFLAGTIVGGLVAGAAALLFAPKTGEETRKEVAEKAGELYEKGAAVIEEKTGYDVNVAVDGLKEQAQVAKEQLEQKFVLDQDEQIDPTLFGLSDDDLKEGLSEQDAV